MTKKKEYLIKIRALANKCKDKRLCARVTSVSRSGMSRHIHFVAVDKKGNTSYPTYWISQVLGLSYRDSDDSLYIQGCGMDMIFECLYRLNSNALWEGIVRKSAKKDRHYLQYHGIVDTSYRYI